MSEISRNEQLFQMAMETGEYKQNRVQKILSEVDFTNSTPQEFLQYLEMDKRYGARVDALEKSGDLMKILDNQIHSITLSITGADLLYEAQALAADQLRLDYFKDTITSLICQFNGSWVRDCITICMKKWERNPRVISYIAKYLEESGYDISNFDECVKIIVGNAPSVIAKDPAPDYWKAYYLLHEVYQDANPQFTMNTTDRINSDPARQRSYYKHYEDHLYEDMPESVANQNAYDDVTNENPGLFAKAGAVVGRVMNVKYEAARNFQQALRNNLGNNADAYFAERQAAQQQREMMRQQRFMNAQQHNDADFMYQQQLMQMRQQYPGYAHSQYNDFYNTVQQQQFNPMQQPQFNPMPGYMQQQQPQHQIDPRFANNTNTDFAPKLPPYVIALITHVIIVLAMWLFAKGMKPLLMTVGLVIASFGWIRKNLNEPNPLTYMIAGYIIAFISLIA